jgi:hypothetical protein
MNACPKGERGANATAFHPGLVVTACAQAALEELKHDHRIALHRVNGELEAERAARLEILQSVDAHAAAMAAVQGVRRSLERMPAPRLAACMESARHQIFPCLWLWRRSWRLHAVSWTRHGQRRRLQRPGRRAWRPTWTVCATSCNWPPMCVRVMPRPPQFVWSCAHPRW